MAQVIYCEFCEISKNTFFYKTPPVAGWKALGEKYLYSKLFWSAFPHSDQNNSEKDSFYAVNVNGR